MDSPPVPVSSTSEVVVPSVKDPHIAYVIRPLRNVDQPAASLANRMINRKRTPLIRRMREMILDWDFSADYDAKDRSRIKEVTEALLVDAMGLEEDDLRFIEDVESVIIGQSDAYYALAEQDEELAYDLRLLNLAAMLCAVEKDGVREPFPPKSIRQRHIYLRDKVDPQDILELTLAGANLMTPTIDTIKNSEPPFTSDSDLAHSSAVNGQ